MVIDRLIVVRVVGGHNDNSCVCVCVYVCVMMMIVIDDDNCDKYWWGWEITVGQYDVPTGDQQICFLLWISSTAFGTSNILSCIIQ